MSERAPAPQSSLDSRPLLLCADDFGLSRGVNEAIADLVRHGRLSAFSCLSNGQAWAQDAALARSLRPQAQAGLHFNLTEGAPLSPALARICPQLPALPRLIADAHLRRLPLAAIAAELAAQWQAVADALGAAPDFIDGHQHVHHLPGVRQLVLDWLQRQPAVPAVRNTGHLAGPGFGLKRWLIERTGGRALAKALKQRRWPHNSVLLGAYDFNAAYRPLMQAWLRQVPASGALLFCHPGRADVADAVPDAIAAARVREWAYLSGPEFAADLQAAGVVLMPTTRHAPTSRGG